MHAQLHLLHSCSPLLLLRFELIVRDAIIIPVETTLRSKKARRTLRWQRRRQQLPGEIDGPKRENHQRRRM